MPNAPVVVTFALPQESSDFRQALPGGGEGIIRVEHLGVGPEAASRCIGRLLAADKPQLVICAGFAGGLDPQLATADLVIADNLSTPDTLALVRNRVLPSPHTRFGAVVSRELPIETTAAKAALHRETRALAVDMESEAVAVACCAAAVPLLVVRTISDAADAPLPVPFPEWFDLQRQEPRPLALVKYLAFHPGRIGPFTSFVRGLKPARRALTRFLLEFLAYSDSAI